MTFAPLKGKRSPRKFLTYDLEWIPHTLELRLIGVFDGKQYRAYDNVADFLNSELTYKTRGHWFYAHAGGLYDLRFVLEHVIREARPHVRVSAAFSGSSAIIVKVATGGKWVPHLQATEDGEIEEGGHFSGEHCWYFLDSFWLLRQSLRKIGGWIGQEKGGEARESREKCKFPHADCTCDPIFRAPFNTLKEYNRGDCEILWKAIDKFEDVVMGLGGELQMTVASTAMNLFRRAFLKERIKTSERINETAREAYVASRVEVFRHRCDDANYYDVNSSFPYAMTFPVPGNYVRSMKRRPDSGIYIAKAKIRVPECFLPPLPYRTPDRRVYFPTGEWDAWFSNVDLEHLEECGGEVLRVDEVRLFHQFHALKEYAETIYELRKNSPDEGYKQILKILLNSLYGKFAEAGTKQKMLINPSTTKCPHRGKNGKPLHADDGAPGSCFEFLTSGIWLFTEEKKVAHAHVPISMHITATARRVLDNHMRQASEVFYCDTDGFACPLQDTFPTSDELGGLKHEKTIQEGRFVAPKLYAMRQNDEWSVRAKGFSGIKYPEFCKLLEEGEVLFEHFSRFKEGLRRGVLGPEEVQIAKGLGHKNPRTGRREQKLRTKRCFQSDGSSRPWDVAEINSDRAPTSTGDLVDLFRREPCEERVIH